MHIQCRIRLMNQYRTHALTLYCMNVHRSSTDRWSVFFRTLGTSWNCGRQDILFSTSVTKLLDFLSHCSWKMSSTAYDLSTQEVYQDWMSCTWWSDSSKQREHSSHLPPTSSAKRYLSSTSGATAWLMYTEHTCKTFIYCNLHYTHTVYTHMEADDGMYQHLLASHIHHCMTF